eukprot:TRINITY_DN48738_c0_g1_i1.p1 TRINITY_DN48738_c0_g1~~TRINITY_DN48738_c0_g1_i1.p1  ORF type:complete len:312 (-),score=27.13 TRINITY_DN48738_c0_g1_i1:45-941(-)
MAEHLALVASSHSLARTITSTRSLKNTPLRVRCRMVPYALTATERGSPYGGPAAIVGVPHTLVAEGTVGDLLSYLTARGAVANVLAIDGFALPSTAPLAPLVREGDVVTLHCLSAVAAALAPPGVQPAALSSLAACANGSCSQEALLADRSELQSRVKELEAELAARDARENVDESSLHQACVSSSTSSSKSKVSIDIGDLPCEQARMPKNDWIPRRRGSLRVGDIIRYRVDLIDAWRNLTRLSKLRYAQVSKLSDDGQGKRLVVLRQKDGKLDCVEESRLLDLSTLDSASVAGAAGN